MLTQQQQKYYKACLDEASSFRESNRKKYIAIKYDSLFLNGEFLKYAFTRFFSFNEGLIVFENKPNKKNAHNAIALMLRLGCHKDYAKIQQLRSLFPMDRDLCLEYCSMYDIAHTKLTRYK